MPDRLNIVLSHRDALDLPEGVRQLRSKDEVVALAITLDTDVFVIGGASVFDAFANDIDRWIVTEVPVVVEEADTFMPSNFLDSFELESTRDLGEGLTVKYLVRRSQN